MRAFERCGLHVIALTVTFAVTPVYGGNISRNAVIAPLLPQGDNGIAAKYPGDVGIEDDPSVIFVEDFEEGSLTEMKARWENVKNINIMSLSRDVPGSSAGERSLLMKHIGGSSTGGHLYRRLLPGCEKLHLRFYVKFDSNCNRIHHFVHMGGYNPPTRWPQGGAGTVSTRMSPGA